MKIVLFILNLGAHSSFHYSTKNGRDLVFQWVEARQRHEIEIPHEEWIADDYRMAKDLLDQALPVPVFFDVLVEAQPNLTQDGRVVSRLAHTQEIEGSNPSPATISEPEEAQTLPPEPKPKGRRRPSLVLASALKDLEDPLEAAALVTT
jgi:hypothetical protein